jgi:hypothetical protein
LGGSLIIMGCGNSSSVLQVTCIANPCEMENDMENLVMLGQAAGGLGIFFLGIAALWLVSVYSKKKK